MHCSPTDGRSDGRTVGRKNRVIEGAPLLKKKEIVRGREKEKERLREREKIAEQRQSEREKEQEKEKYTLVQEELYM